jgi:GT2 family glycosyltransferase
MDVSIVLVSYNTEELTKNCIKSIYEKTEGLHFDVWVVDNASKDNSIQTIKEEFPQVKLIESKENLGFGRANNLAIRQSNAKYILLLNTDTILINNAIKILFDYMELPENQNVGGCGGQLYNSDMTLQGSTGQFDDLQFLFKKCFGLNWTSRFNRFKNIYKKNILKENHSQKINIAHETDFIIGADLMLRKSVLDKIDLFDERFFMFAEEAEICFRVKKYGHKIMFVPDAKIIHFGGGTTNKQNTSIEVEKMRLTSDILFYKICYGDDAGKVAKFFFIIYYFRYLFLRLFSPKAFKRLFMAINAKL